MGDLTEHFSRSEFACKCGCGKVIINHELVEKLESIRKLFGKSMIINSATRCKTHNTNVKGSPTSSHLSGYAVDIKCDNSTDRFNLIRLAIQEGIKRIVIYKTFVHMDNDPDKPQNLISLG